MNKNSESIAALFVRDNQKSIVESKSESTEQMEVMSFWLSYSQKNCLPSYLAWHTPNGGFRSKSEAMRLKKLGVVKGVPDLFFAIPSKGFHGLFVEMKNKTGRLGIEQENMLASLAEIGYKTGVAFSSSEAIKMIKDYFE